MFTMLGKSWQVSIELSLSQRQHRNVIGQCANLVSLHLVEIDDDDDVIEGTSYSVAGAKSRTAGRNGKGQINRPEVDAARRAGRYPLWSFRSGLWFRFGSRPGRAG